MISSPTLTTVKHLRIALKGTEVFLTWDKEAAASKYQVRSADKLSGQAAWSTLNETSDNFVFDKLNTAASGKFYTVLFMQ